MGPRTGLDGRKIPDRPAHRQLLYRLSYPVHMYLINYINSLVGSDTSKLNLPVTLLLMTRTYWIGFSVGTPTVRTDVFVFPQFFQVNDNRFVPHRIVRCYRQSY